MNYDFQVLKRQKSIGLLVDRFDQKKVRFFKEKAILRGH
jgi:hypothetical protein